MGVSTDAILFYGIDFEEGQTVGPEDMEDGVDWERTYATLSGLPPVPYGAIHYPKYLDKKRALVKAAGVALDSHCHSDLPIYFVYLVGAYFCNRRGDCTPVHLNLPCPKEEADAKLKAFCEKMSLPYKEPRWLLVSYMG